MSRHDSRGSRTSPALSPRDRLLGWGRMGAALLMHVSPMGPMSRRQLSMGPAGAVQLVQMASQCAQRMSAGPKNGRKRSLVGT